MKKYDAVRGFGWKLPAARLKATPHNSAARRAMSFVRNRLRIRERSITMKRVLGLALAILFVIGAASAATYYSYGSWMITPSSVRTSNNAKKEVATSAKVRASVQTPSDQTVWYGLRNFSGTARVHTSAVPKTTLPSGEFSIAYKSGEGVVGMRYVLSIQIDSDSTQSTTVAGTWRP